MGPEVPGYRIESELGRGGMGTVYEATQLSLNRRVALKILSPQYGQDRQFRERFRREGQIQAAIDHPHIVTVHEAGELADCLFLAMRLVRGGTLKDMIVARELEGARILRLLKPIADALDTAHEAGLIHRDIKPQNILIGPRDHAYLADFGLTKRPDESALTKTGQFVGTIDYISPEQILGEPTRAASDIYSLTAVLFECLAGVVPFPKPSDAAVIYAHLADPAPLLTDQRPELPSALDDVIARGMAKVATERYESAAELIQEAERAFGKRVRAVITPPGPVETAAEIGLRDPESRVRTQESRLRTTPVSDTTVPLGRRASKPVENEPQYERTTILNSPDRAATRQEYSVSARDGSLRRQPDAPRPERSRHRALLAAGTAAVSLALAIAGFTAGRSGREEGSAATALTRSASNEHVQLSFPATWSRRRSAPEHLDLALKQAIAIGPQRDRNAGLVFGRVGATDERLMPAGLAARIGERTPGSERIRVGPLQALRYSDLRSTHANMKFDLVVAPTSIGTMAFACHAASAALVDVRSECIRVVRSVELVAGKPAPVDASPEYASVLNAVMGRLDQERTAARRALADARTSRGQGSAAARLSGNYAAAARSVRQSPTPPRVAGLGHDLLRAFSASRKAYDRLAEAARTRNPDMYSSSARAVRRAETAVQRALRALTGAGYKVG